MLHIWDAIEADFLRDYRIRLVEHLEHMSWRYFLVLLHNLTPYGAVAARVQEMAQKPSEDEADDEAAANAFFASVVAYRGEARG